MRSKLHPLQRRRRSAIYGEMWKKRDIRGCRDAKCNELPRSLSFYVPAPKMRYKSCEYFWLLLSNCRCNDNAVILVQWARQRVPEGGSHSSSAPISHACTKKAMLSENTFSFVIWLWHANKINFVLSWNDKIYTIYSSPLFNPFVYLPLSPSKFNWYVSIFFFCLTLKFDHFTFEVRNVSLD